MQLIRKNGATSNILRAKLRSSATGNGLTGLGIASSGLIISTICDNESSATNYTAAGSTIETIAALGTFATPTATKCRFKEVDATNQPGLYELQFADARFAVSSAKTLRIAITGAASLLDKEVLVQLTSVDVDDSVRLGLTALPNAAAAAAGGLVVTGASNAGTTTFAGGINGGAVAMSSLNVSGQSTFTGNVAVGTVSASAVSLYSLGCGAVTLTGGMSISSSDSLSAVINVLANGANSTAVRLTGSGSKYGMEILAGDLGSGLFIGSGDITPSVLIEDAITFGGGLYCGGTATFVGGIQAGPLPMTSMRNSGNTTFAGAVSLASTLAVTGATTLGGISHGSTTFSGVTLSSFNNSGASTFGGNVLIGGNLNVTGGTTFTGTVTGISGAMSVAQDTKLTAIHTIVQSQG